MSFTCAICEQEFADIPDGAVELAPRRRGRRSYLYRFSNGAIHDLRVVAKPEPPMVEPVEEVKSTADELEIIEEVEESPSTAMAAAFHRLFKS